MKIKKDMTTCTGCRACEQICPKQCIHMATDNAGFLYPEIDESACSGCGLCQKICNIPPDSYNTQPLQLAYAVKNKNSEILMQSSSGGMFYGLADCIIKKGGIVFGAVFDEDFQAYHRQADNMEDVHYMMGSKYVQSDTRHTYSEAEKYLKQNKMVLYTGTPCQIAGIRNYLQKDYETLFCVSIICHGVPSPEVWKRYLSYYRGRQNNDTLLNCFFRDKTESWRMHCLSLEFEHNQLLIRGREDIYMKGFIDNLYLRNSCYHCPNKANNDSSDIIIGDYWGVELAHPGIDDTNGVSAVIANTEKGKRILLEVLDKNTYDYEKSTYQQIAYGNISLFASSSDNPNRKVFFRQLAETNDVYDCISSNLPFLPDTEHKKHEQYPIIMKYLQNKLKGWSIQHFFDKYHYKNVALYSATEFAELALDDIRHNRADKLKNLYICDLNAHKSFVNGFAKHPVISIDELITQDQKGNIDCIIICNLYHRNEIKTDLIRRGIEPKKIITIFSVIFSNY